MNRRVGVIIGESDGVLKVLGNGEYVGDEVPIEAVGMFADMMRKINHPNPKIVLDNGDVVYGCECWFGSIEKMDRIIASHKNVVTVNIGDIRREYREQEEANERKD